MKKISIKIYKFGVIRILRSKKENEL